MLSLAILPILIVAFFYDLQRHLGLYFISLWPSVLLTLIQWVGGKSSCTLIGMRIFQLESCMLFGMPVLSYRFHLINR